MNKKIIIFGITAVFILVTISLASAYTLSEQSEKKESPLFRIRTKQAIKEKIAEMKSNYLSERIFIIPLNWFFSYNKVNSPSAHKSCLFTSCCLIQNNRNIPIR